MLHEGSVGAKVFVEFLKRLMLNAEKPVFLIVDGHPIHKAKMVKSYIRASALGSHRPPMDFFNKINAQSSFA